MECCIQPFSDNAFVWASSIDWYLASVFDRTAHLQWLQQKLELVTEHNVKSSTRQCRI